MGVKGRTSRDGSRVRSDPTDCLPASLRGRSTPRKKDPEGSARPRKVVGGGCRAVPGEKKDEDPEGVGEGRERAGGPERVRGERRLGRFTGRGPGRLNATSSGTTTAPQETPLLPTASRPHPRHTTAHPRDPVSRRSAGRGFVVETRAQARGREPRRALTLDSGRRPFG